MKNKKENIEDEIVFENEVEEKSSFKKKTKDDKKSELDDCKKEKQEYLDG